MTESEGTRNASYSYLIDDPPTDELDDIEDVFGSDPLISFCVPTLNDAETLSTTLESWESQTYPAIEIIVVDGGSDDGTVKIAERYADVVLFDDGQLGSARQTGLDAANGAIVGLFDGDIVLPHQDWLRTALARFGYGEQVSTVWPQNVSPPASPTFTQLYFNHWNIIIEDRIEHSRGYFGGGNALFRRDHLEAVGGINPKRHWGEDFDWAGKLHDAGYQTVYHRDPVYHDTMRSLPRFLQKQFLGAEAFTSAGFELMGLTTRDVLREQFLLGILGMVRGLLQDRDSSWLLYPPYIVGRTLAYVITAIGNEMNYR